VRLPRDAGLTLLEVMVALAIIGVMSGVAVLGLNGAGRGMSVEAEARRLSSRLRLAADETLVTGRDLALDWDARSYGFVSWSATERRWTPSKVEALGPRHQLPSDMRLEGAHAEAPALIAGDGIGPPIVIDLKARSVAWRVAFDGLNVAAARATGG
jgi:general secretion pathway protein H